MIPHAIDVKTPLAPGLILFLCLSFGQAWGQRWVHYTTAHGLAGTVNHMLVDREGDLWFATHHGVNRFTGAWETFRTEQGLVNDDVRAIAQDGEGNLWLGTMGGISRVDPTTDLNDPGNWRSYTVARTNGGLSVDAILSIVIDREGKLWFGTNEGGISVADPAPDVNNPGQDPLHDARNWVTFNAANGALGGNQVYDLELDAAGNVWAATSGAVNIFERQTGSWRAFDLQSSDADKSARAIFKDARGHLWIGTIANGVYRAYPDHLSTFDERYTQNAPLAGTDVIAIAQDQTGALWFGHSDFGATMIVPEGSFTDNYKSFRIGDGLANGNIRAIAVDHENNIWFGHGGDQGVSQLDRTWSYFLTDRIRQTNFIESLYLDNSNSLWIATRAGAGHLNLEKNLSLERDPNEILFTNFNSGLNAERVFNVFQDSRSQLWFATDAGTFRVAFENLRNNQSWRRYSLAEGLASRAANGITEDRLGYIWLATAEGVSRVHLDSLDSATNWLTLTTANGLASNQVFMMLHDSQGRLWLATDAGVSLRLDPQTNPRLPGNWRNFDSRDGLAGDIVRSIYADLSGHLWFATERGASQVDPEADLNDPNNWKNLTTQDGLAGDFVTAFAQLKPDEMWVGTASGLSRYKMNDPLQPWTTYTTASGLTTNFITSLLADSSHHALWIGTEGGGVNRYEPKSKPPQIFLASRYDLITANPVTFVFHGEDVLTPRGRLRYQHRLDSRDWIETSDEFASLFIENLEAQAGPQRHVFEVRAIDGDGNTGATVSDIFYTFNTRLGGHITDEQENVRLYLPPGVFSGNASIRSIPNYALEDSLLVVAAYDVLPDTVTIPKRATLAISIERAAVSELGPLAIFRWEGSQWGSVGGTLSHGDDRLTLTTAIKKFGRYAVRREKAKDEAATGAVSIQPRMFSPAGGGQGHGERAMISFTLPQEVPVTAKVYDLAGRLKHVLCENISMPAGFNVLEWDGRDEDGRICVSGLYLIALTADGKTRTQTVMVSNKY